MFVGHAGIALGAAGLRPGVPLFALVLAAFGVDLLEAALWAVGAGGAVPRPAESVPVALAVSAAAGLIYGVARRDGRGAALVVAVALSHLPADLVSGTVGLWPGTPAVGLDLFMTPAADWAVEGAVAAVGWAVWRRSLPPPSRRAPLAVAVLVGLLAAQAGFLVVAGLA